MNKFEKALDQLELDPALKRKTIETFAEMLKNENAPHEYWRCIDTGCYKECYEIGNVIIKFAIEENRTFSDEAPIYIDALSSELDQIFAKTFFIRLDNPLPAFFVEGKFDCVIVQEKADKLLFDKQATFICDKCDYQKYPLKAEDGTIIPYQTVEDIIEIFYYQEWTQACINFYGLDFMSKLTDFCIHKEISDLHGRNIGFREDGSPIIFDFLSARQEEY